MEPFKTFFSPGLVRTMAGHLSRHLPGLDPRAFAAPVLAALEPLELKARAQLIADHLHEALPGDPGRRAGVLAALLHPDPLDHADRPADDEGLCGWAILPLTMVVGQHGVQDFDRSMALLREMTKRFSSEFGIRYFLLADQARAFRILEGWLGDPNRHVRRLISEGTRPRLPWAMRLPALMRDPAPALPLLEHLRDDPEAYVRRSVANHLNDISKDHPALVARLAADWMAGAGRDRRALLSHACRSLIKRGDPGALAVFGRGRPEIADAAPELSATALRLGERLDISFPLRSLSDTPQELTVDYVLHLRKANGRLAPKVFKGAVLTLTPGETRVFGASHVFREVTTRRHYPGEQALSLRINGVDTRAVPFRLDP
jgi:3-methyladenine DNA glycosylase AlkC